MSLENRQASRERGSDDDVSGGIGWCVRSRQVANGPACIVGEGLLAVLYAGSDL